MSSMKVDRGPGDGKKIVVRMLLCPVVFYVGYVAELMASDIWVPYLMILLAITFLLLAGLLSYRSVPAGSWILWLSVVDLIATVAGLAAGAYVVVALSDLSTF